MDADLSWAVVKACGWFLAGLTGFALAEIPLAILVGRYIANNGVHPSELEPDPDVDLDLLEAELAMEFHRPVALAA